MSNQRPLPMRNMADLSDAEQTELLKEMNAYLGSLLAEIMFRKTQPAPTATGRRDAPTLDAAAIVAGVEELLS